MPEITQSIAGISAFILGITVAAPLGYELNKRLEQSAAETTNNCSPEMIRTIKKNDIIFEEACKALGKRRLEYFSAKQELFTYSKQLKMDNWQGVTPNNVIEKIESLLNGPNPSKLLAQKEQDALEKRIEKLRSLEKDIEMLGQNATSAYTSLISARAIVNEYAVYLQNKKSWNPKVIKIKKEVENAQIPRVSDDLCGTILREIKTGDVDKINFYLSTLSTINNTGSNPQYFYQ